MHKILRQVMTILIVSALLCLPLHAAELAETGMFKETSAEKMTADALLVRPLGIASTVLGTAFFIVSLPFSIAGGNVGEASERLVVEPARFTFARPLGDFSQLD